MYFYFFTENGIKLQIYTEYEKLCKKKNKKRTTTKKECMRQQREEEHFSVIFGTPGFRVLLKASHMYRTIYRTILLNLRLNFLHIVSIFNTL